MSSVREGGESWDEFSALSIAPLVLLSDDDDDDDEKDAPMTQRGEEGPFDLERK